MIEGLKEIQLGTGAGGQRTIVVGGVGANLGLPAFPLQQNPPVVMQLENSNGACWEADYPAPAQENDARGFKESNGP